MVQVTAPASVFCGGVGLCQKREKRNVSLVNEVLDGVPALIPQEPVCKGIPGSKPHDSIHRRYLIA